jgi:hypothetical protein
MFSTSRVVCMSENASWQPFPPADYPRGIWAILSTSRIPKRHISRPLHRPIIWETRERWFIPADWVRGIREILFTGQVVWLFERCIYATFSTCRLSKRHISGILQRPNNREVFERRFTPAEILAYPKLHLNNLFHWSNIWESLEQPFPPAKHQRGSYAYNLERYRFCKVCD